MTVAGSAEAFGVLRALLEANQPAAVTAYRWQNEDEDSNGDVALPDTPAPFVYCEFLADPSSVIEIGGGRGANRHRCPANLELYVFVPRGTGLHQTDGSGCLDIADEIAALLRSFAESGVTVDSATAAPGGAGALLKPQGLSSDVTNYFWAIVTAELYFDLIG